VLGYAI